MVPTLHGQISQVRATRVIIAGTIGGAAASPTAGTNITLNSIGGLRPLILTPAIA